MFRVSARRVIARRWYQRPQLHHINGENTPLAGVFSAKGLQNAWFDRAQYYASQLNKYTQGTQETTLENIIYEDSRSYIKRHVTNYASLLYNLEFALQSLHGDKNGVVPETPLGRESLLATPEIATEITNQPKITGNLELHQLLESSFGSIAEFKTLLLNSAMAISGEGFTWLVARKIKQSEIDLISSSKDNKIQFDKLFVLNTYNAGTPFNFNRANAVTNLRKTHENKTKNNNKEPLAKEEEDEFKKSLKEIRRLKEEAVEEDLAYIPLLAIDASPKAWLHDYGVFGKQQYLENVWNATEWKVVESRLAGLSRSMDSSI
ncbi:Small ribosomal subunit protein mS43 [Nakaseomyces bracarensis]|uniref:Small ribosomal subunit protein mS43 n=1 Tax=Nakaseomyces bracarensis TaxID=273131 RepID=A0ABR4NQ97_9SACH